MCRERELLSKTQHNENAMNWNASPIIAESEFPARKIFSWRIKWWRKKMEMKKRKGADENRYSLGYALPI